MKNGPKGHGTGRNRRTVWHIATQPYPGAHFATFPEKLVEPCILAGSPVGGVILDPFVGSGTTMAVAQQLGRLGIGVDLSDAYLELATKRLGAVPYPMQHNNYSDIEEESDSIVEDDAPVPWMDGMFNEDSIASDPVLPDQDETAGEEFDRLTKPNRESLEKMKKELFG
jgi:tRNA G10  N-methylase Trm11